MTLFIVNVNIFYLSAEIGNNDYVEMQLKFQNCPNSSALVYISIGDGIGIELTAAKYTAITQLFLITDYLGYGNMHIIMRGQNWNPQSQRVNTNSSKYDIKESHLNEYSAVVKVNILYVMMKQSNIMTTISISISVFC